MILVKSLIVLLLLLIIAHFIKVGWGNNDKKLKEGFREGLQEINEINALYDPNIADDLESQNSPHVALVPKKVQDIPPLGGDLAPPIGPGILPASQKAQVQAQIQQSTEEENTVGKHKKASDDALKMNYLKQQMEVLVQLGNEAQGINNDFKNNR